MSTGDQPSDEHQVGITNAQEGNPDAEISRLTREMNAQFAAGQYVDAAHTALAITALSKDELRQTFETREQFEKAADLLVARLRVTYPEAQHQMQTYIVLMPKL
jgi:hypothetical protein